MLHFIYSRPLSLIVLLIVVFTALWSFCASRFTGRRWRLFSALCAIAALFAILYTTIFSRTPSAVTLILQPFAALAAAKVQPEFYREMLMNMLLFFPLGLALSHALPSGLPAWARVCITVLAGCVLSIGIEVLQYRFALGTAETDDVICNTLGALIGAASLPLSHLIQFCRERFRKHDPDHN